MFVFIFTYIKLINEYTFSIYRATNIIPNFALSTEEIRI
jgi:hypothetical protein